MIIAAFWKEEIQRILLISSLAIEMILYPRLNEDDYGQHIVLQSNQFLSDILHSHFERELTN